MFVINSLKQIPNLLLKNFAVGGLRVSEVDQLVQEFVDDDEVVSDAFLFDILEVILKNLKKVVK